MLTVALPDELADRIRAVGQDVHNFAVAAVREKLNEVEVEERPFPVVAPADPIARVRAHITALQKADNTPVYPPAPNDGTMTPSEALFRFWEQEDALLTNKEREAAEKFWKDYRQGINEERDAAGMRRIF